MKGPSFISELLDRVRGWLEENDYESVEQLKGSMSQQNCPDPSALVRANYMKTLTNYTFPRNL
jgi:dihydroorotate dehydrogenase (fumarate)